MPTLDIDQCAAYNHRNRALTYGLTSHFTMAELKQLRKTQGEGCPYCKRKVRLHVDRTFLFRGAGPMK